MVIDGDRERGLVRSAHIACVHRPGRAIDRSYFSKCQRPLYLASMAVEPDRQRHGIGRAMLEDVKRILKAWPGDAIRLDAYDLVGGAGEFYARCGYREMGRVIYRGARLIYYELLL